MKIKYLHYYILDFRDVLKPGIMNRPFQFKNQAQEIAKIYFKPHEYKIKYGFQLTTLDLAIFEERKFSLYSEARQEVIPANIIDKNHEARTKKRARANGRRSHTEKLQQEKWLLRCVEDDLPTFIERFERDFTTDIVELNQVKGAQHIIEFLGGRRTPKRRWDRVPTKDFVYGTNILKTLIKYNYDNGPFYRYHISLSLWRRYSQKFIAAVDVTEQLQAKGLQ